MMKRTKWWLAIFFLCLLPLVGCGQDNQVRTETIIFPTAGEYASVIFNVPETWIDDMSHTTDDPMAGPSGYLVFGPEEEWYAGTRPVYLTGEMQNLLMGYFSGRPSEYKLDQVDWPAFFEEYLLEIHPEAKDLLVEEMEAPETGLWEVGYTATFSWEGESYRYGFGIGPQIYCLWGHKEVLPPELMQKILFSLRLSEDPENVMGKYAMQEFSGDWDKETKALLETMLKDHIAMDLPIQRTIIGYKIHSMEPKVPAHDIPQSLNHIIPYPDQIPWDMIYPSVRVYQVDYELIPYRPEQYMDFAGGDFQLTEEGNKRYTKRYAVFAENNFVDHEDLSKLYFLGFISPSDLAEIGMDASVLKLADRWFENTIVAYAEVIHGTPYVGDAMKVGSLIMSLPFHETINTEEGTFAEKALAIQTEQEPYGIVVNYWLEAPLHDQTGLSSRVWNRDADPFPGADLNPYIKRQVYRNMGYIFSGVQNVTYVTIHVWTQRGDEEETFVRTTLRGQRNDFPEVVYDIP